MSVFNLFFLKVFLNQVFDLSNLQSIFAFEAYESTFWETAYATPSGQDLSYAHNDALHLTCVNKLAIDATLELLYDLIKEEDPNVLVKEKMSQSFGYSYMLLQLSLKCLSLQVFPVPLLSFIFKSFLSLNHVECLLRNTMLREHIHLRSKLCTTHTLALSIFSRLSVSSNRLASSPLATIVTHLLLQLVFDVVFLEETLDGFEVIELRLGFQLGFPDRIYRVYIEEFRPLSHIDKLHVIIIGL